MHILKLSDTLQLSVSFSQHPLIMKHKNRYFVMKRSGDNHIETIIVSMAGTFSVIVTNLPVLCFKNRHHSNIGTKH